MFHCHVRLPKGTFVGRMLTEMILDRNYFRKASAAEIFKTQTYRRHRHGNTETHLSSMGVFQSSLKILYSERYGAVFFALISQQSFKGCHGGRTRSTNWKSNLQAHLFREGIPGSKRDLQEKEGIGKKTTSSRWSMTKYIQISRYHICLASWVIVGMQWNFNPLQQPLCRVGETADQ